MPEYVFETVVWATVAAFVVLLALSLLDVAGLREIKDAGLRKKIHYSVLLTAVCGVATYAGKHFLFATPDGIPSATTKEIERSADPQEVAQEPDAPQKHIDSNQADAAQNDGTEALESDVPEAIRVWAASALGSRPSVRADIPQPYPPCVRRVGEAAEPSEGEASACVRELQLFHRDYILTYYNKSGAYQRRLEDQEAVLRRGGVKLDELERYNFVQAEVERLNGPERTAIVGVDLRYSADLSRCLNTGCR